MSYINLPLDQQREIAAIDVRALEAAVGRCERDEQIAPIYALGLSGCGEFIASEYRAFERALAAHSKAKAHAKREQTRADVLRAGSNLVHAVEQMQEHVKTEQEQAQLFVVDDQIMVPSRFSSRLTVTVCYRWRPSSDAQWAYGRTVFAHDFTPLPDYTQTLSRRKPSAAKAANDLQEKLYREWEHLKMQALCAVRDFLRGGGDGADIPESFAVRASQYGGGLNNFSCRFWVP
ncbi:MAG: hypothetical protein KKD27_15050 [Gammaproteobacteria bacterium]|jgi:hypothetical protein|uniref:Uncharacterized protein n=1 Tax=Stutzerimonas stutzeri TaxID=316 RepID=A0A172WPR4_STUST|nr:hypothetical protein [Stutzerimonas stutzeri]MAL34590.1 hypothetical protein [Pseudomonas sp.]MBU2283896.1 hypothetical protein [Gammaproteobacteria bacterium]BAP81474.1 hypothetical protein MT1_4301 [Pseudomonas sp. MT-1]ANF25491.1 hypothetical protein PS273GM_10190 [Stutzerimonas stutzeri]MBK3797363.1 hypothetical protein [Stutzerimonas stutzeri]|tara:strand:- start:2962 stop:3660 length:699 start_codon:yes stop_codon:yes gene_type:complete